MLKGKTALVTGSTSGIGLGIAKALARQGANIVLNGFGDVDGPQGARSPRSACKVGYHGADMSKPAEIEAMMKYAAAQFGRVDMLVNNAGIQHVAPVEDFPPEKMGRDHRDQPARARSTRRASRCPHEAARTGAASSTSPRSHGLVASAQKSAYVAAKHGIVGLTKVDRAGERATTGITVQRDLPGLGADAAGAKAGRRTRAATRHDRNEEAKRAAAGREGAVAAVHHAGGTGRAGACSSARRRRTTCAAWRGTWMAAGRRNKSVVPAKAGTQGRATAPPRG